MKLHADGTPLRLSTSVIGRLTSQSIEDVTQRRDYIAYSKDGDFTAFEGRFDGYGALFSPSSAVAVAHLTGAAIVHGASPLDYVADGDVVLLTPSGRVSVLYR